MTSQESTEPFDIKKLPRIEISKPMDSMMRFAFGFFLLIMPAIILIKALSKEDLSSLQALIVALSYYSILAFCLLCIKRNYVLDGQRQLLMRQTAVLGHVSTSVICTFKEIGCIAIESLERQSKSGPTGQFWYESRIILKNRKVIKLHRTFEDSYDEIQDAQQYADYIGCKLFGPKPGLEMKILGDAHGNISIEFVR